jgi:hypothetical protein
MEFFYPKPWNIKANSIVRLPSEAAGLHRTIGLRSFDQSLAAGQSPAGNCPVSFVGHLPGVTLS